MMQKISALFLLSFLHACSADTVRYQELQTEQANFSEETPDNWPKSFGLGKEASVARISSMDIDVRPDGKGLPSGSGTVAYGRSLYLTKCVSCHGSKTSSGIYDRLFSYDQSRVHPDSLKGNKRNKTIGNYWPYATTLYDYINRAMPFNAPGSLRPNEVYSLTAYLLYENSIIDENTVLTAMSLPRVKMPAQKRFVNDTRKGGAEVE
ncbi:cytochrome c [Arcticibacter pallidicorallinus]|uniref:Cytochrome c n=1 Tax=Arcticibacter pallidicorallinus TaxID=1259464 RepID=A0A2T0U2X8_9SPHI|nr:cytochrome c [Arcticibacter pallidicorallinus]PRY52270.1 cytochrome c [Arcticibacter pallidicorallinus]